MDRLRARQAAFNTASRSEWESFAEHRQRLTNLLSSEASTASSRLCVLGAGNANDIDLPVLLAAHREVHLVDLDTEALARGTERQGVSGHPRLWLHGGVDVTAMLIFLSDLTPLSRLNPRDIEALAAWPADRLTSVLPGTFDLVASTCLLSQILESAAHTLGPNHSQLAEVELALRAGHLQLMSGLASPRGRAVLVAEVVSSRMFPGLLERPTEELVNLLAELAHQGNHFRGVHPKQLLRALRADASLGPLVMEAASLSPWRWRLHDRTYLVSGLSFRVARG